MSVIMTNLEMNEAHLFKRIPDQLVCYYPDIGKY